MKLDVMIRLLNKTVVVILWICGIVTFSPLQAQIINVGVGSYTMTFPGTDAAGRNSFPSGTPQLSGAAVGKPVPTNDWWSPVIKSDHAGNLFNYPMSMQTVNAGLVLSYIPWGVFDDQKPIIVGLTGLNANKVTVSDYSDWLVNFDWFSGGHQMTTTMGIGMPFVYYEKQDADVVQITVNLGTATISNERLIIENARNGADYVIYAPVGSTWTQNGKVYTSDLNGQNYWSSLMLPLTTTDVFAAATAFQKYAYVFPTNTMVTWSFDENQSIMKSDFVVETEVKEGVQTHVLLGLLPHQWANLSETSLQPNEPSYETVRGELKMIDGNSFTVENIYHGILPTLPYLTNYSEGFSISKLNDKVHQLENDGLSTWTDSYNEGQVMNRLIQTARIADLSGNTTSRDKMLATIKDRLEDWLSVKPSEVAFLFYYNSNWSALLGYPAGHGQDGNINDHHFHWGYFIHAAAFLEQYQPGWASEWGDMVNLLVRDAASPNRNDALFPFLRNFSPYAGHCWANGFATFPQGNDQESTSESMQFNSSLIHWGTITGNDEIRDLGIYLYTTEQTAIEEYWLDVNERNFKPSQQYSLVSRVWGNSYDNGTFWTSDLAASYGIELYPIHGGSLYLGHNQSYAEKLWAEIEKNTGILKNEANDNLWHDIMWEYLSFTNPQKAIDLYDSYPNRNLKFGVSDAQTYYWLHAMNAMGQVDITVTADYPIAVVFNKEGEKTYTAHNYTDAPLDVTFSDGFVLSVPARSMATNKDVAIKSELTSSFAQAYINGSVDLNLSVTSGEVSKVEFYDEETKIDEATVAPYETKAKNLSARKHTFYAKVYSGDVFDVSNLVTVIVGQQKPYGGTPIAIPGTFEAGNYDKFEGGKGQSISYQDVSLNNNGDYRKQEDVDAAYDNTEGATVGWISSGEWLEYTIQVAQSGFYDLSFRYASDNDNGGGPFHFELNDKVISTNISVSSTGDWGAWKSKSITNIPLIEGENVLKIYFDQGEFNLGKMTFSYSTPLDYDQPVAKAGDNVLVIFPATSAMLDGSLSVYNGTESLTYLWRQLYGPSEIVFSDNAISNPEISSLVEGIYAVELTFDDGIHADTDVVLVIVNDGAQIAPIVAINSQLNNSKYIAGKTVKLTIETSDLDGTVVKVEYFADDISIGMSETEPFAMDWVSTEIGVHTLTAIATDNDGNKAISQPIQVTLTAPPSCQGKATNRDFDFRFSDDIKNPTLTFIPSKNGVGAPTCILYYTSTGGEYPGYNVTPNVPYKLVASEGSTVSFYYTYSYPNAGEKNTSQDKGSYVVGSCVSNEVLSIADATFTIDENSTVGTVVGTPVYSYKGSDNLAFSIKSGNNQGAFEINTENGLIKVAYSLPLDFETTPSFSLQIELTDGTLTEAAVVTINLKNIEEAITDVNNILNDLQVYPNPARDQLTINWLYFEKAIFSELSGKRVMVATDKEIDLKQLPKGVYILTIIGRDKQSAHRRIVKE